MTVSQFCPIAIIDRGHIEGQIIVTYASLTLNARHAVRVELTTAIVQVLEHLRFVVSCAKINVWYP